MTSKPNKEEMIRLVEKIIKVDGTQEEIEEWLRIVESNLLTPTGYLSGLIFWPDSYDLGPNPTAEEIIDKALSYKPIQL